MKYKLSKEQEKRFEDKFATGIGGVLVSRGGTSVVSEKVKQFLADEIAVAVGEIIKKVEELMKCGQRVLIMEEVMKKD